MYVVSSVWKLSSSTCIKRSAFSSCSVGISNVHVRTLGSRTVEKYTESLLTEFPSESYKEL